MSIIRFIPSLASFFLPDMLMLSPELLHMHLGIRPHSGTREGDIFAFGLIVQELMYRCVAYNDPSDAQGEMRV